MNSPVLSLAMPPIQPFRQETSICVKFNHPLLWCFDDPHKCRDLVPGIVLSSRYKWSTSVKLSCQGPGPMHSSLVQIYNGVQLESCPHQKLVKPSEVLRQSKGTRKHRKLEKEKNAIKKEQNAKLQALRGTSQQCEDRILAERESCFPRHPYSYSTPLSGINLVEMER
uniref:Uncharacterized protein n=1 Tax=Solanum tuberosum TaxID=4113 RepID=M1D8X9_SOLTU